jgi:hypothetical protein
MPTATRGLSPLFRQKTDHLRELLRHLDRHRRGARRRGHYDLANDLREATRLLRVMALDEREALS